MKRLVGFLVLGILLVSIISTSFVLSQSENANLGKQKVNQNIDQESKKGSDEQKQNQEQENKSNTENQGLGQIIRKKVRAGIYTSETGKQIRISKMAQNKIRLQVGEIEAETDLEIEEETRKDESGINRTKLKVRLSNGRNAEIKVMPDVAAQRALERLRLRVCSEENNCTIVLKEVPVEENKIAAYELQVQRPARILGLIRTKMKVKTQVSAENGEVIRVKKPWWAFLAYEPEE